MDHRKYALEVRRLHRHQMHRRLRAGQKRCDVDGLVVRVLASRARESARPGRNCDRFPHSAQRETPQEAAAMSIRPVKRIIQSQPTIEGAGVKLHRAFGFGETSEFDPFLLFDDFRNDRPDDYLRRLPLASASRHRDHHLRARRHGRARRQPRQPRHARRRRRAVDDRRQRHHPPGDAAGRRSRPHARLPALGQPAVVAQDDRAALPGRPGDGHPRGRRRRRHARARGLRRLLGQAAGRWRASPPTRATSTSRCRRASARRLPVETAPPRLRLRLRGLGHVPRRVGAVGGADREGRAAGDDADPRADAATARWCCSTAATR